MTLETRSWRFAVFLSDFFQFVLMVKLAVVSLAPALLAACPLSAESPSLNSPLQPPIPDIAPMICVHSGPRRFVRRSNVDAIVANILLHRPSTMNTTNSSERTSDDAISPGTTRGRRDGGIPQSLRPTSVNEFSDKSDGDSMLEMDGRGAGEVEALGRRRGSTRNQGDPLVSQWRQGGSVGEGGGGASDGGKVNGGVEGWMGRDAACDVALEAASTEHMQQEMMGSLPVEVRPRLELYIYLCCVVLSFS